MVLDYYEVLYQCVVGVGFANDEVVHRHFIGFVMDGRCDMELALWMTRSFAATS